MNFPINLHDLVPTDAVLELSTMPGKKIVLGRWSLRVRSWATQKYGSNGLKEIFEKQMIDEIADIAFFMLKDKEVFKTKDEFLEQVVTVADQVALIKALLGAIGIGEPEIKKISDSIPAKDKVKSAADLADPKSKAKRNRTGAKSSTR